MDNLRFNPLIDSFSEISNSELSEKISDLSKKYFMTKNPEVQNQIRAVLDMYKAEAATRQAKETLEEKNLENGENSLDNLINIS
mgnify:CR=1 FL=1|tara:strand:- start:331 stop:582 length:252 start_codon:yes stop_codon:yes gene_type:complete